MNSNVESDLLELTLESYSENSRSRQQCAVALAAFANHLKIELPKDWGGRGA